MKKIFYLTSLLLFTFCKTQSQIIDSYGDQPFGTVNNAYYKDVNGFLNQYVGTWLYTNGTSSLKIIFQKREHKYMPGNISYYTDLLVGEYQYIENGIEKVNTLNQINTDFGSSAIDMRNYNLHENSCIYFASNKPKCNECVQNEKRLKMNLSEPNFSNIQGLSNSFVLRSFEEGGITKLKVWFYNEIQIQPEDENGNPFNFTSFSLPFGEYILIKQ
jgi:hypothetical protein